MLKLVMSRLASFIPLLALVGILVFSLFALTPIDQAAIILGDGSTAEARAELTHSLGLDQPFLVQLGDWITGVLRGDLGESFYTRSSVTSMLVAGLGPTIALVAGGMGIAIALGVALGALSGSMPNTIVDRVTTVIVSLFLSIPGFWLALLLVLLLSVQFRVFPVAGYTPFLDDPVRWVHGLILPWLAIGLHATAVIARQMRSAMIDAMQSEFVRALLARGVTRRRVVLVYGLKNAIVPVLAITGMQISVAIGVSFVVERVFSIPGLGTLLLDAVTKGDLPLLQGAVLVVAAWVIVVNLSLDLCYAVLDPRVRVQ